MNRLSDFIHKCFKGGYNCIIFKVAEFSLLFTIYQSIILLVERVKQDLIVFLSPDFNVFCQNIAVYANENLNLLSGKS